MTRSQPPTRAKAAPLATASDAIAKLKLACKSPGSVPGKEIVAAMIELEKAKLKVGA